MTLEEFRVLRAQRRAQHKTNVTAAFDTAKHGTVINLTALMIGAEQTGAPSFGGDATEDLTEPLASDQWRTDKKEDMT